MRKPRLTPIQFGVLAQVRAGLVTASRVANGVVGYSTRERGVGINVTRQVEALIAKGYVQPRRRAHSVVGLIVPSDSDWKEENQS